MENLLVNIDKHIATVTLNRPDKMNALNIQLFDELIETGNLITANSEIRVVVMHGNGRGFCAGLDLENFQNPSHPDFQKPLDLRSHGNCNKWQKAVMVWRSMPAPVITAVHGVAFGGGLQLMSAADIKYVHPDTQLSIMEMKWGIIPDMGGSVCWPHHVRLDILKELIYTHRIFHGPQAVQYGFATHVSEHPLHDAMALAKEIAAKNPQAIQASKHMFNQLSGKSEDELLLSESVAQQQIMYSPNQKEAVMAILENREAMFS